MASSMGGGVMRTAASSLVGVGTVISGVGGVIRRLLSIPKLEYQLLAAARRPASAIAASTEGGQAVSEKASWEVGDTECASLEDDVGSGSSNSLSLPRVVFVGAPTFDEAKEASMELKEAVEKTLTPENTSLPLVMASEDGEATTCVSSDIASTLVVRKHVVQAFRILSENPAAQNVVASIASDLNVWNAVFQNAELVNYVESHRTGATSPDIDARLNQHIGIVELQDLRTHLLVHL
uniref:Uncharacterized protein n=1 Tax=Kalanchoe fedtschenkoi TaxID=63787 RepID=A0A7N0V0J0_KALFE